MLLFPACTYLSLKDSRNRTIASMGSSNSFSRTPSQPCPFNFVPSPVPAYIAAFFLYNDVLPFIYLFHSQTLSHVRCTAARRWQFSSCVVYQPGYLMLPVIDNLQQRDSKILSQRDALLPGVGVHAVFRWALGFLRVEKGSRMSVVRYLLSNASSSR